MTIKEDAAVLREVADRIEKLEGFNHHVESLRKDADFIDPPKIELKQKTRRQSLP